MLPAVAVLLLLLQSCSSTPAPAPTPALLKGRALLYQAENRYAYPQAIQALEEAVAEAPDDAGAALDLAYAYTKRGRYAQALPLLDALAEKPRTLPRARRGWLQALHLKALDRVPEEAAAWARVTAAQPQDRWAWYEQASALASLRRFDEAAAAAAAAARTEPDPARWESSWLYYLHSKALYRAGRYAAAGAAAARGKGNATTWRSTYFRQALAELKSGVMTDPEVAVAEYLRLAREEARTSEEVAYANIALFFFELGDYDQANSYATQAMALGNSAYPMWTRAFAQAEAGQPAAALELASNALTEHPDHRYLTAALGWAHYRLGDAAAATAALEQAVTQGPRRNFHMEALLDHARALTANPASDPAPPIAFIE